MWLASTLATASVVMRSDTTAEATALAWPHQSVFPSAATFRITLQGRNLWEFGRWASVFPQNSGVFRGGSLAVGRSGRRWAYVAGGWAYQFVGSGLLDDVSTPADSSAHGECRSEH